MDTNQVKELFLLRCMDDYTLQMKDILKDNGITQERLYSDLELKLMYMENKKNFYRRENLDKRVSSLYSSYVKSNFKLSWEFIMFQRYFYCSL